MKIERLALFALLLLAQACLQKSGAAVFIVGELTSTSYTIGGLARSTNAINYSVTLQEKSWNIKATNRFEASRSRQTDPADIPYLELSFDGQDLFSIVHVSREAASRSRAAAQNGVTTIGEARTNNYPQGEDYFVSVIWLAYASQELWPSPPPKGFPSFFPRSRQWEQIRFATETNKSQPYLPKLVEIFSNEPGMAVPRKQSAPGAKNTNALTCLRGKLVVTEWHTAGSWQVPARFTFSNFDNIQEPDGNWRPAPVNVLINSRVSIHETEDVSPKSLRPVVSGGVFITDHRFTRTNSTLNYYDTNRAWVEREGPDMKKQFAFAKQQMKARRDKGNFKSRIVLTLLTSGLLCLGGVWLTWRLHKLRESSQ